MCVQIKMGFYHSVKKILHIFILFDIILDSSERRKLIFADTMTNVNDLITCYLELDLQPEVFNGSILKVLTKSLKLMF